MTRARALGIFAAIAVLAAVVMCVRLGFWQLARLEEKRDLNAARRAAFERPPVDWAPGLNAANLDGRRVRVRGRYDEGRHILLRGKIHEGEPGVVLVTPLWTDAGDAVLVVRGWLPADDGLTASPQDYPEPGSVEVLGVASSLPSGTGSRRPRLLADRIPQVFSAATLDRDSLALAVPYPVAAFAIRQLPGAGVPARPVRTPEAPENEGLHLGYAVQWFAFAVILVAGSTLFAWTRRGRGSARNLPPNE